MALAVVLIACGQAQPLLWTFIAVTLHECAHALAARSRGYVLQSLDILPFGAVLSSDENMDGASSVIVGAAGPVANLILAGITLGFWWLFPSVYSYTEGFLHANLALAFFNILPIYPLDGSRVVLGYAKNKLKAVKFMRAAGVVVSLLMFSAFIASFFVKWNFTLGIVAVFLFYGAAYASEEQSYVSVFSPGVKDYNFGVVRKEVIVFEDVPIARLFQFVSPSSEVEFALVDKNGKRVRNLSEKDIKELALKHRLSTTLKEAMTTQKTSNNRNLKSKQTAFEKRTEFECSEDFAGFNQFLKNKHSQYEEKLINKNHKFVKNLKDKIAAKKAISTKNRK